jgi:hypothetical protein
MPDKERKVPFPMDDDFSSKVKDAALSCGVNVLCNMGFAGMHKIDTAAMTPPFTVTEPELVEVGTRLKMAIEIVSKQYLVDTRPKVEINAAL